MRLAPRTHRPRPLFLQILVVLGMTFAPSCSSGGDKEEQEGDGNQPGGQTALSAEELLGSWLLFTTSDDPGVPDEQVESLDKDLFPVEIARDGAGGFELRFDSAGISDSVEVFVDGDELAVSGSLDTEEGSVEIDARWEILDDGDFMTGPLGLLNAVGEESLLEARVARVDSAFANHPLVGSWEWALTTLEETCEDDGDASEFVVVDILHFRDDQFFALLSPDSEVSFLFELEVDGAVAALSGRDEEDDFGVRVSGSALNFAGDTLSGQMTLTSFGEEVCESVVAVEGLRDVIGGVSAPTGSGFLAWIEAATTSPRIMLVDPDEPFESLDLGLLDSPLEFSFLARDFAGVAYGGRVDPSTGEVTRVEPKALVLLEDKHLELVDLRVRRNSLGEARAPQRVLASIPAIANPSDLRVFSDLGDLMAVATVRENNTNLRLFEIGEGGAFSTLFMPSGEPKFTAFHPRTGEYRGLIVEDGGVLSRVRPGETQEISQNASRVLRTTDGSLFFQEGSMIRGVRWDTDEVFTVGQLDGDMRAPVVDGNTLYFVDRVEGDPITLTLKRARMSEGSVETLDINFVPAGPGFGVGEIVLSPLPSSTHVWFSFASPDGEVFRTIDLATKIGQAVPGEFFVISSRFTLGALMCLSVFNFDEFDGQFRARTYQGDGSGEIAHTSTEWTEAVQDSGLVLGERREPLGIVGSSSTFEPDSLTLRVLRSANPSAESFVGSLPGVTSLRLFGDERFGVQQQALSLAGGGDVLLVDFAPDGGITPLTVTGDSHPIF